MKTEFTVTGHLRYSDGTLKSDRKLMDAETRGYNANVVVVGAAELTAVILQILKEKGLFIN